MARRCLKKAPVVVLTQPPGLDQPGMGMTNRVLPAQGEERGTSLTLMGLDGAKIRKFQGVGGQLFRSAELAQAGLNWGEMREKTG
jgi:hypothetical protein